MHSCLSSSNELTPQSIAKYYIVHIFYLIDMSKPSPTSATRNTIQNRLHPKSTYKTVSNSTGMILHRTTSPKQPAPLPLLQTQPTLKHNTTHPRINLFPLDTKAAKIQPSLHPNTHSTTQPHNSHQLGSNTRQYPNKAPPKNQPKHNTRKQQTNPQPPLPPNLPLPTPPSTTPASPHLPPPPPPLSPRLPPERPQARLRNRRPFLSLLHHQVVVV